MLNLVVSPAPNVLVLLFAAIGLAPVAVARLLQGTPSEAAIAAGFYAASLALLPSALGLCDDLHTSFNGVGLYLLALVAVDRYTRNWANVWCVALLITTALPPATEVWAVARQDVKAPPQSAQGALEIVAGLEKIAESGKIYAPAGAPLVVREDLMHAGRWADSYFCDVDDAYDLAGEQRKLAEMRNAAYVLFPVGDLAGIAPDNRFRLRLLRLGLSYPVRRPLYHPFALLAQALHDHYRVVGSIGNPPEYLIYQREN